MLRKDECKCKCCSQDLILFMNELLIFDKDKLLGVNGVDSVKCHKWFDVFNWKRLYYKPIVSPIKFNVPEYKGKCVVHVDDNEMIGNVNEMYKEKFKEFTFMHVLSQQKVSLFNCRTNIKQQMFSPVRTKENQR